MTAALPHRHYRPLATAPFPPAPLARQLGLTEMPLAGRPADFERAYAVLGDMAVLP